MFDPKYEPFYMGRSGHKKLPRDVRVYTVPRLTAGKGFVVRRIFCLGVCVYEISFPKVPLAAAEFERILDMPIQNKRTQTFFYY